mmetsp:Transcript_801/g.970  ORF Transcript_801/g.970 Transcript_801/m.970 type:complete len:451 (+) Transcript_801:235-1587(+)
MMGSPSKEKLTKVLAEMDSLEVRPGVGLGNFELGMHVNEALQYLREYFLPERPTIDIIYSRKFPLSKPILLRAVDVGVQLHFDPVSQRLTMIEVSNFTSIPLRYSHTTFTGPSISAEASAETTFLQLYNLFGPTYPGSFDAEVGLYILNYRGLSLLFPIPETHHTQYSGGNDLPLEIDGNSPQLKKMYIFGGFDLNKPSLPKEDINSQLEIKLLLRRDCTVDGKPTLEEPALVFSNSKQALRIGSSVQDVLSELGSPSSVHFKENDKMKIHALRANENSRVAKPASRSVDAPQGFSNVNNQDKNDSSTRASYAAECFKSSDYFYNFFKIGIDFLFDCKTHTVKKMILHTNFPGHPEFSIYRKCQFKISGECLKARQVESDAGIIDSIGLQEITSESTWNHIEAIMGPAGKPMIHDSGAVTNPFGGTFLYAYDGIVFEIMKNGHVASLTLF